MNTAEIRKVLFEEIKVFGGSLNKVALHYKLPYSTLWNLINRGDEYEPDWKTLNKIALGLGMKSAYSLTPSVNDPPESWAGLDIVDKQILKALVGMIPSEKRAILEYIEDQKLLKEIKRNR